jgi:ubiquinone/menaquinone biosynthesis C-methylase UbiE
VNTRWHEVWNRRALSHDHAIGLQDLIELDGFDTGAGRITAADWRDYARAVIEILGITAGSSVYEVGCGSGAFLYALREQRTIQIGGSDYASPLIDVARIAIPDGDFSVLAAGELPQVPSYDFVISNGVFHYFPDIDYSGRVISRMIAKSRRAVAVLEVPDQNRRAAAERVRRDKLSDELYEQKYAGLEHLYYTRKWFLDIATLHNMNCRIFPSPIPNYAQSEFRFAAFLIHNRITK